MVRRAIVVSLILAAVVTAEAGACSCVPPEHVYARAKVAYIGTVVEHTAERTTIDVERAFKGQVSGRVTYSGTGSGVSSCEPEIEVGQRIGVMAEPGGALSSCTTTQASELERIARPLPEPDGQGPPAFLVGGSFKDNGVVALDVRGRVLRYGPSIGYAVAACPRGRTVVGVDGGALTVRRVSDFKVLRRLPSGGATSVRCLDAAGRRVVSAGGRGPMSIWVGARRRSVRVPHAQGVVALGARRAILATGSYDRARIVMVDYETRRARTIHTTDGRIVYSLALSPDERRVLVASSAMGRGSELRVVPVGRGEDVASSALGAFGGSVDVSWPARGPILLALERELLEIDPATLAVGRRVSGWGDGVVVRAGAPYGVTASGELVTPDFAAGAARRIALLPRARVGPLVALPQAVARGARASSACRWRGIPSGFAASRPRPR